jgi:hypothetical protein
MSLLCPYKRRKCCLEALAGYLKVSISGRRKVNFRNFAIAKMIGIRVMREECERVTKLEQLAGSENS